MTVSHDVHWRLGVGSDGHETYTPRTVIYDSKVAFGSLPMYNQLYDNLGDQESRQSSLW
jgi:hypothetical protein